MREESVVLYPNPAKDVIHISANTGFSGATMGIFDHRGRSVYQILLSGSEQSIDVSQLQNGLYTYRITKVNSVLSSGKFTVSK